MGKILKIDSLDLVINAVGKYQEELQKNSKILKNAADALDVAIGSEDMAKKNIARLNAAMEELKKASDIAEEVKEALVVQKNAAIECYNV